VQQVEYHLEIKTAAGGRGAKPLVVKDWKQMGLKKAGGRGGGGLPKATQKKREREGDEGGENVGLRTPG